MNAINFRIPSSGQSEALRGRETIAADVRGSKLNGCVCFKLLSVRRLLPLLSGRMGLDPDTGMTSVEKLRGKQLSDYQAEYTHTLLFLIYFFLVH